MSLDLDSKLASLQQYAPAQTARITDLDNPEYFLDCNDPVWNELWLSTWGRRDISDEHHEVRRGPDSNVVNEILLPNIVPPSCRVMTTPAITKYCTNLKCDKILVRPEYDEAEEFALSKCDMIRLLVITGKPGSGSPPYCQPVPNINTFFL